MKINNINELSKHVKLPNYIVLDNGCWKVAKKLTPTGYVRVCRSFEGKKHYIAAHRLFYAKLKGNIPEGLVIDHLCRNRACVNPEHLEPVTNKENLKRGMGPSHVAVRTNKCKRGHEYTTENTYLFPKGRQCKNCRVIHRRDYRIRKKAKLHL